MSTSWRKTARIITAAVCGLVFVASPFAAAQQTASPNYQLNEVFFGNGGELNACSATYCAKQTAGDIAAGHTAGTAFQAEAGFNTDRTPYLAFSVAGGPTDLGVLSTVGTATATATFAVKTYLANGYVVQFASDPPTNIASGHQINPLATATASAINVEQFGVNLVANTTGCGAPANFGAPPVQVPDNTFSFGTIASGYNTCGLFKYVKGDAIASSTKSSGQTDYTLSFIYNIDNLTADGTYNFSGNLVATSTF